MPSPCFLLDIFCASIAFPLQDKFLHRRLDAVGTLCSILSWDLHSRTKLFRRSIRTYHVISAFYRVFSPSSHFVCFLHNILLSLGMATTQLVYCASSGFCICFPVPLSEFSGRYSSVNLSKCFCTPSCKLRSSRETLAV